MQILKRQRAVDWRVIRWPILGIAWFMLLISLALPASWEVPFVVPLPYVPVGLVVILAFTNLADPTIYLLILPLALFVASPFLALRRIRGGFAPLWFLAVLALLAIWALPPAWGFSSKTPAERGWNNVAFGFYVYAFAHTMAFVVCMLAPLGPRRPDSKRGFPVVVPDEGPEPPHSG